MNYVPWLASKFENITAICLVTLLLHVLKHLKLSYTW